MRLFCWYCHKSVSTELPQYALFRAIAVCPECIESSHEARAHPLNKEIPQQNDSADEEPEMGFPEDFKKAMGKFFARR